MKLEPVLRRGLLLAIVHGLMGWVALRPIDDPDVFWHLRTGDWVLEHHAVPGVDPFSQVGRPWVAYSWLLEVVLALAHRAAGFAGVSALTAILCVGVAAAVLALVRAHEGRFTPSVAVASAALVAMLRLAAPRPWLVSILLLAVVLRQVVLARRRGSARPLALLPLAFALWANLHVQFVYGLAALGIATVEALVERSPARRGFALALAGCAIATLANPYHAHLWAVVLEYASGTGAFEAVSELNALEFRSAPDWAGLACALGAAFALGHARERRPFPLLLFAMSCILAFRAGRDVWMVALAACAIVPAALPPEPDPPPRALRAATPLVAALGLVAGASSEDGHRAAIARAYPVSAAAAARALPGPLYNGFDWGGYLIWSLPGTPVSLDGRTNLHGDERIARSRRTWAGQRGWDRDPELAAARLVIAPRHEPLVERLRRDARWRVAHEDDVAVVFAR